MVSDVLVPLENKTVAYELRWNKKKRYKSWCERQAFSCNQICTNKIYLDCSFKVAIFTSIRVFYVIDSQSQRHGESDKKCNNPNTSNTEFGTVL